MEEHLVKEIGRRFERMPASKRIAEVRDFMRRSAARCRLIEKAFPDLYREATAPIPRPSGVSSPESAGPQDRVKVLET